MKKLIVSTFILGSLLTFSATACNSHNSSPAPSSSGEQVAKQETEKFVANCVPPASNSVGQIQFAESLSHQANRAKLSQCLGIPKSQQQNFEGAALSDAEHVKWSDQSQRSQFYSVTLPNLAMQYRNK